MIVLYIEANVMNPVRINIAIPMTYLYLSSYCKQHIPEVSFIFHSLEIDSVNSVNLSTYDIYNNYKPDIVICSAISCNINQTLSILKQFKSYNCYTVLGGIYATSNDAYLINNHRYIDVVIKGEGEITLLETILNYNKCTSNNIKGTTTIIDNKVQISPSRGLIKNLDELPLLDYRGIPARFYAANKTRYYVFTSRGCDYSCDFCTLHEHWGGCTRYFSIERTLAEIANIVSIFKPAQISFGDDTLDLQSERVLFICNELIRNKFPVKFGCKTRLDMLGIDCLQLMYEAGFAEISIGVESNNEEQLQLLNKSTNLSSFKNLYAILLSAKQLNVRINLNFILGVPNETKETLQHKMDFIIDTCNKYNAIPLLSFITPHCGTSMQINHNTYGLKIVDSNNDNYTHLHPVCIPTSMGVNAIDILKETYNTISKATCSEIFNPLLEA